MITVKKKPLTPNIIWDASGNRSLCKFVNGVVETDDKELAFRLEELGHTVEWEVDAPILTEMKLEELKAYAAEHNIDLGEAKNKADILKAIQEAEE